MAPVALSILKSTLLGLVDPKPVSPFSGAHSALALVSHITHTVLSSAHTAPSIFFATPSTCNSLCLGNSSSSPGIPFDSHSFTLLVRVTCPFYVPLAQCLANNSNKNSSNGNGCHLLGIFCRLVIV